MTRSRIHASRTRIISYCLGVSAIAVFTLLMILCALSWPS